MTHGGPHPTSGSSYIIICNGRIGVAATKDINEKIAAASKCARDLACYLSLRYYRVGFDTADLIPLQLLQHKLMDHLIGDEKLKDEDISVIIGSMFDEFEGLEEKYDSGTY